MTDILHLRRYATFVFDCDGVLLDSNRLKTEAFRTAARPWGETAANALVAYHVANGGISRYVKFARFLDTILLEHVPEPVPGRDGPGLDDMLAAYAQAVQTGLTTCAVADGLEELRAATRQARWLIVSGGDQCELRAVFAARGLADYFDGGIFGSPDTKDTILSRELAAGTIERPALFLGDSRLDHEAARRNGIDFVFVSSWTEFSDWRSYTAAQDIRCIHGIQDLM